MGVFFSRMWVENARRPRTLPLAVSLKRFLEPEWVFIFGMGLPASKADVSELTVNVAVPNGLVGRSRFPYRPRSITVALRRYVPGHQAWPATASTPSLQIRPRRSLVPPPSPPLR